MIAPHSIRVPIVATLLLLGVLLGIGWRGDRHLAMQRAERENLLRQAAGQGMVPDSSDPIGFRRPTRGPRAHSGTEAGRVMADYIARVRKINRACANGTGSPILRSQAPRDHAADVRDHAADVRDEMEMVARIRTLNRAGLKALVAELCALGEIGNINHNTQERLQKLPLFLMALDYPQDALEMMAGSPELLQLACSPGREMKLSIVFAAVSSWARADPAAATAWFRSDAVGLPDAHRAAARAALIYGTADYDPRSTLALIKESAQTSPDLLKTLVTGAQTRGDRLAMLAICRALKASPSDDALGPATADWFIHQLIFGVGKPDGFAYSSRLIEDANLPRPELQNLTLDMERKVRTGDAGRWIEWLAQKLPPEVARERIRKLMPRWHNEDPEAAEAFAQQHGLK